MVLSGKIDRIEENNEGERFVVDWKSGAHKWKRSGDITENLQTLSYRIMLENNENNSAVKFPTSGADVIYLGNQSKKWESRIYSTNKSGIEFEEQRKNFLEKTIELLSGDKFAASGVEHNICGYCPLKNSCKSSDIGGDIL